MNKGVAKLLYSDKSFFFSRFPFSNLSGSIADLFSDETLLGSMDKNIAEQQLNKAYEAFRQACMDKDSAVKELKQKVCNQFLGIASLLYYMQLMFNFKGLHYLCYMQVLGLRGTFWCRLLPKKHGLNFRNINGRP